MQNITKNEMEAVLIILKSPEVMYNANSLAKVLKITSMGALKILKRLEKESIILGKQIGNAKIYRINTKKDYARKYVTLLLARESMQSSSTIKHWVNELRNVKSADLIILFGSVMRIHDPNDIDVLFVTNQQRFKKLEDEVNELNKINVKKIHAIYQSTSDIIENIKKRDKPLLNAIKGIVVRGEEMFLEVYNESRQE
jgi:predicted nucleotidyltransferase